VSLSWSAAFGAESYNVYRNGTKVNTSAVTGTSYTDSGLSASTTYSYTVAAVAFFGTVGAQFGAVAGRAHQSLGYVYANGSNQAMGLWNVYTVHTLKETAPNYYVIADGQC
jgi:hypothetical protein